MRTRVRASIGRPAGALVLLLLLACAATATPAYADFLPSRPITFWDDHLIVSGDASITIGSKDEGYFNAIDYYHDALNVLRLGISFELKANDKIALLGQVIDQTALRDAGAETGTPWPPFETNRHIVRPYALFVRVQPWDNKPVTIQAGRIPPVFGAFARQDYGGGQALISLPLAYHYPTTLRPDAAPLNADALVRRRGNGWRVRYLAGVQGWASGVPIISALRWDSGAQVRVGDQNTPVDAAIAVTAGTLSDPRFNDNNDRPQVSGRVGIHPIAGLTVGVSASRGEFLSEYILDARPDAAANGPFTQTAFGTDLEYSRGNWLLRSETIVSSWRLPAIDPPLIDRPLRAWASFVEGRVKLSPRWYAAARLDHLGFSTIDATAAEGGPQAWDGPVTRVEIGGGYTLQRNVRVKVAYQYDWRDAGFTHRRGALATQLVYWF
jgi:hypothetical protein